MKIINPTPIQVFSHYYQEEAEKAFRIQYMQIKGQKLRKAAAA